MGLPLRNPTSISSLTSGAAPPGGHSITSDSDSDLDPSEPLSYRTQSPRVNHPGSKTYPRERSNRSRPTSNSTQQRKLHRHRVRQTYHQQAHAHPATAETHHVKPRNPWAADADEGCALAQSGLRLPGESEPSQQEPGSSSSSSSQGSSQSSQASSSREGRRDRRRHPSSSRSSSTSDGSRSRPPSLERQNAFRDDKTAKRRRSWDENDDVEMSVVSQPACWGTSEGGGDQLRREEDDKAQVAELYRMGLLYDDEYERGEGFSLDRIVREEPAYSLRVRPANSRLRRGRRDRRAADYHYVSLSSAVDLAFSALGEDEALAGWLLSPSASSFSCGTAALEQPRPRTEAAHDTPRLTVIYELADDAVSAVSADDFLDSVSVSEVSYCGGEDDDEQAWAMLKACNGAAAPATVEVDEDDIDPWVVLGHDGS